MDCLTSCLKSERKIEEASTTVSYFPKAGFQSHSRVTVLSDGKRESGHGKSQDDRFLLRVNSLRAFFTEILSDASVTSARLQYLLKVPRWQTLWL